MILEYHGLKEKHTLFNKWPIIQDYIITRKKHILELIPKPISHSTV